MPIETIPQAYLEYSISVPEWIIFAVAITIHLFATILALYLLLKKEKKELQI